MFLMHVLHQGVCDEHLGHAGILVVYVHVYPLHHKRGTLYLYAVTT